MKKSPIHYKVLFGLFRPPEFPSEFLLPEDLRKKISMNFSRKASMNFLGNSGIDCFRNPYKIFLRKTSTDTLINAFNDSFRKLKVRNSLEISPRISLENLPWTPSEILPKFSSEIFPRIPLEIFLHAFVQGLLFSEICLKTIRFPSAVSSEILQDFLKKIQSLLQMFSQKYLQKFLQGIF